MLLNILQVVHETKLMLSYIAVVMQTSEIVLLRLSDFFTLTKGDLLHAIERIINKQSNPSVYYLIFSSTLQLPKETISKFYSPQINTIQFSKFQFLKITIFN